MNLVDFGPLSPSCNAPHQIRVLEGVTRLQRRKFFRYAVLKSRAHRVWARDWRLLPAVIYNGESASVSISTSETARHCNQPAEVPPAATVAAGGPMGVQSYRPWFAPAISPARGTHARDGDCPRSGSRPAAGRCSMRSARLTISIPIRSVAATAVAIAQSSDDNATVWNAVCRNGT